VSTFYWERHPDGPFATLAPTTISSAGRGHPNPTTRRSGHSKAELQRALADPGQLPGDELFHAVDYGDGSDETFLRRLWHDLYGDQPGAGADPHRALDAASCDDLAGRLYGLLISLDDRLAREDVRQLHRFIEVGEYGLALEEIVGAQLHDEVREVRHRLLGSLVPRMGEHIIRREPPG